MNKKTIAVKQILKNQDFKTTLNQIGRVCEVPFSDGTRTLAVILTYEGVRSLGIDLNTVFKGYGIRKVFNEKTDIRNGLLVNLNMKQQVVLLRAIVAKKPELLNVLGLYSIRGARRIYEALSRAIVLRQLDIWWMWMVEKYILGRNIEGDYPEEGVVTLSNSPTLEGRRIFIGGGFSDLPSDAFNCGVGLTVFGAKI